MSLGLKIQTSEGYTVSVDVTVLSRATRRWRGSPSRAASASTGGSVARAAGAGLTVRSSGHVELTGAHEDGGLRGCLVFALDGGVTDCTHTSGGSGL